MASKDLGSVLLPNLKSLIIGASCGYTADFAASSLKWLVVRNELVDPDDEDAAIKPYSPELLYLLEDLPDFCPGLEELVLEPAVEMGASITRILERMPLTKLSLKPPTTSGALEVLREVSKVETLRGFDIYRPPANAHDPEAEAYLPFQGLRSFAMTRLETDACTALKLLPAGQLEVFKLFGDQNPVDIEYDPDREKPSDDERMDMAIARSRECEGLGIPDDSFEWYRNSEYDDDMPYPDWTARDTAMRVGFLSLVAEKHGACLTKLVITNWSKMESGWLRPLLQIQGMRHCDFEYAICSYLTDKVMEDVASSWKDLEFFRLYSTTDAEDAASGHATSLAAIQSFAAHFPSLHTLCMDLRVKSMPAPEAPAFLGSWTSDVRALENLTLFSVSGASFSSKENRDLVDQCLRFVFPKLIFAYVETRCHEESFVPGWAGHQKEWKEIFRSIVGDFDKETRDALYEATKVCM